jgi:hypothetical protein
LSRCEAAPSFNSITSKFCDDSLALLPPPRRAVVLLRRLPPPLLLRVLLATDR